jgi:phospholipid/cholesterol/gamma-HCH transport system substrate-binding protein
MSRAFRLGLFIVSTLAILAVGTFLIGERQSLFSRTYRMTTTFKSVSGLSAGAEVRVGGIRQGTVRQIDLPSSSGGEMTVRMDLERSSRAVVKTDSLASIGTEGLLGSEFIDISFGSDDAPPVPPGGAIESTAPLELADLMKKADGLLDSSKSLLDKIDGGQGTIGALVNDKQLFNQLNATAVEAQQGASALTDDLEAMKHNFFLRGFFNNRGYDDPTKLTLYLIAQLPHGTPMQTFHYDVKTLFEDADHAKLKSESQANEAGHYLERTPFGTAVIVSSSGMKGDSVELHTVLQARALVLRDYLVSTFKMDDTRLRTMEVAKGPKTTSDLGTVDIIVYPPSVKPPPVVKVPPPPPIR